MIRKLTLAFLILVVTLATLGYWQLMKYGNQKIDSNHQENIIEIKQGETFASFVHELEKKQVLKHANIFTWYAKLLGTAGKMKVGEYAFYNDMTPNEILQTASSGKSIGQDFTVPEGMNIYELSEMWEDEGFGSQEEMLAMTKDQALIHELLGEDHYSLEGYLFPETYQITKHTTAKKLVTMMVKKFLGVWDEFSEEARNSGMTRQEIVTLASIIEKETGAPEERPIISSVFHNRLQKKMLLQTDPTIIYGKADLSGHMENNITKADLSTPTRYNTYVNKGLPPGPIANPGREAIRAAIEPEQTEYFYFVSKNQGTHVFSKDYSAHQEAVRKYQMDARARAGKSWRDLKKLRAANPPATAPEPANAPATN